MPWFSEPFLTLGKTPVSLLMLATFLFAVTVVVIVSRTVGRLVGSRLLARTAMDPGLQYAVGRMVYYGRSELNFAIDTAFRRHGVLIPLPQRDVHLIPGPEPLPSPA